MSSFWFCSLVLLLAFLILLFEHLTDLHTQQSQKDLYLPPAETHRAISPSTSWQSFYFKFWSFSPSGCGNQSIPLRLPDIYFPKWLFVVPSDLSSLHLTWDPVLVLGTHRHYSWCCLLLVFSPRSPHTLTVADLTPKLQKVDPTWLIFNLTSQMVTILSLVDHISLVHIFTSPLQC